MAGGSCAEALRRWWQYAKNTSKRRSGFASPSLAEQDASRGATPQAQPMSGAGVDVALEMMGMGYLHWGMFVIGGLSMMADGVEIGFVSYVGEAVRQDWNLSEFETASLASVVFVGEFLGSLFFGVLGDRMGRQKAFMISNAMVLFFGVLTRLATNLAGLIALRFFVGFGVGGIVIPFDLFMELLVDDVRGRMLTFYMMWWPVGSIFVSGCAWAILPNASLDQGWRDLALVSCLPFVLPFCCSFILPESPRWYVAQRRYDDARAEIEELARLNGVEEKDIVVVMAEVQRVSAAGAGADGGGEVGDSRPLEHKRSEDEADETMSLGRSRSSDDAGASQALATTSSEDGPAAEGEDGEGDADDDIGTLFNKEYMGITVPINASWFVFGFAYYGGQLFFQKLFEEDDDDEGDDDDDELNLNYGAAMLGATMEIVGTLIATLLVDSMGRVFSVGFGHFSAAVSFIVLIFAISSDEETSLAICFAVAARMFLTTASVSQWVFTPELYPTSVRATGHALCSMSNRVGAIISPIVAASVADAPMAAIFAALTICAALTVWYGLRDHEPPRPEGPVSPLCPTKFGEIQVRDASGTVDAPVHMDAPAMV